MVRNAGTEADDELPTNTVFLGQAAPNTGVTGGGRVMMHAGFKSVGSGGMLDVAMFSHADFTAPGYAVARLTLSTGPALTQFRLSEGMARLEWAGGEGPFIVQRRASLTTGTWADVLTTTEGLADLPTESVMGFFRVIGR